MPSQTPPAARAELLAAFDAELQPERFKDYGPNGLQVEGRPRIGKIVSGVTASRALIDAAIEAGADAIFVHHGLFWRGQDGRVVGWMKERLKRLLAHDINLLAYHLPLDAHPRWATTRSSGCGWGWRPTGASASRRWASSVGVPMARRSPTRQNWGAIWNMY